MSAIGEASAIICAGGTGSRLWPATKGVNKHLLPVYNKPLIYYPLSFLMLLGLRDISLVAGPGDQRGLESVLGNGRQWGLDLRYRVQPTPDGIVGCVQAAGLDGLDRSLVLMLGDNFFYGPGVPRLVSQACRPDRATVFLTHVGDSSAFARVNLDRLGAITALEEKPADGGPGLIATGLYHFPTDVWAKVQHVVASPRGELEVASLLHDYLDEERLDAVLMPRGSIWLDCGTPGDLLEASNLVQVLEDRGGHLVGSPEEVAWRSGWISDDQLRELTRQTTSSRYAQSLCSLLSPTGR